MADGAGASACHCLVSEFIIKAVAASRECDLFNIYFRLYLVEDFNDAVVQAFVSEYCFQLAYLCFTVRSNSQYCGCVSAK